MKKLELVPKSVSAALETKVETYVDVHNQAMAEAADIKNRYLGLFETLLKVEARQFYYLFEVPSLYIYCVELLELSPSIANDFINVVRKSLEIPELADSIRSRKLTISKARKICSVITPTDHEQWIELAEVCSARVVEKTVAQSKPRTTVHETMKYVSEDVLEFKLAVSEEWQQMLEKSKDLLSQKHQRAVSSEEALLILMKAHHVASDPILKAERALKKKRISLKKQETISLKSSRYRNSEIENQVNLRDQNQCTYRDKSGNRCKAKRWLHN